MTSYIPNVVKIDLVHVKEKTQQKLTVQTLRKGTKRNQRKGTTLIPNGEIKKIQFEFSEA